MKFQLWNDTETLTINNQPQEIPFSAKDVLKACLPDIAKQGYSIDELKRRKSLLPRIESAESDLDLDKEDTLFIIQRLDQMRFPVAADNLLKLREKLNEHYVQLSNSTE